MEPVLAKVEGIIGRIRLWAWVGGAFIAIGSVLAWLTNQVAPIAAYGLAAPIIVGFALACLALLALAAIGLVGARIFGPRTSKPGNQYLSDAIVVSGHGNAAPSFCARFARNGREAVFYIEFSSYYPGSAGGWTSPITIRVASASRFTQGETITFPLMRSVETREGVRWQFGEAMQDGFPVHMIGGDRFYRGRVKCLSADDVAQSCYFFARAYKDMSIMPDVYGEHLLSHLWEWEGKPPPNGNAASLFGQR